MAGLFDDVLGSSPPVQYINDQTGRFGGIHPVFQNQLNDYAQYFFNKYNEPLILGDTLRTQEEQAVAHRLKPTLALPAGHPNARHPVGLAVDVDEGQSKKITDEELAQFGLHRPALSKGETWHIEPMLRQVSTSPAPQSTSGLFDDILSQPAPQPGKVQSIPDLLGGALAQDDVTLGQGIADMGGGQPSPNLTPDQFNLALGKGLPSLPNVFTPPGQISGIGVEDIKKLLLPDWRTAGAGVGGMAGKYLGGPLGGAIGGGLGFAGTQMVENLNKAYQGEQLPSIPEQLRQYGKGFMVGAAGQGIGDIIPKVLSPFSGRVAQRMADNPAIAEAQALVEKGAPISPSEIADTKTSKFFEWMADKVWPASAIMAKKRNSLQAVAEGLKNEFVASRGLYETSKKGIDNAWTTWVDLAGGPEATYPMPNATAAVNEAMGKPFAQMGTFWKKHAATFQQEAQNGEVTVQGIRNLFNTLSPSSVKGAERTARMKIADAIMADLGSSGGPEVTSALQNAREMTFQNRVVAPLRNIFNQSMVEPTAAGDTVAFNPSKFVNLWNQKRSIFIDNKNYSEADIAAIDKFANQMRAMIPDLAKGAKFTPATSLAGATQLNLENPLAVATGVYKMPLLAVPVGMDAMMAQSLMNPNGIMRQLLTTGYKPPTLPIRIGITQYLESKFLGGEND